MLHASPIAIKNGVIDKKLPVDYQSKIYMKLKIIQFLILFSAGAAGACYRQLRCRLALKVAVPVTGRFLLIVPVTGTCSKISEPVMVLVKVYVRLKCR